jgi:hypothetical protein
MPWIVSLIFYVDEDPKEFLSAFLIAHAIEFILYISILWVYNGFEEERKDNNGDYWQLCQDRARDP